MKAPWYWDGRSGQAGRFVSLALTPLGWLFALAGRLRGAGGRPYRPSAPVICVGNLVAGGAGKTPTVLALCDRLQALGLTPHILTRGYGGAVRGPHRADPDHDSAATIGDEAALMARRFPVWVGADRAATAKAATRAGAEILVMDDGFQNPSLVKDLSLVVIDAAYGHGNGRVMPAGPLREPLSRGFARADAVVMIGDPAPGEAWPWTPPRLPVLHARLTPLRVSPPLSGRKVMAFAGIGRPEKFFATLRELGATIVDQEAFPDHASFATPLLARLEARAARHQALLVTTEKDAMRLPRSFAAKCVIVPVALGFEEPEAVEAMLERVLEPE
jgi:tetraacyldisaccharide 4'-kinase